MRIPFAVINKNDTGLLNSLPTPRLGFGKFRRIPPSNPKEMSFGKPLSKIYGPKTGDSIGTLPQILTDLIKYLSTPEALGTEGILRLSGNITRTRQLREALERGGSFLHNLPQ